MSCDTLIEIIDLCDSDDDDSDKELEYSGIGLEREIEWLDDVSQSHSTISEEKSGKSDAKRRKIEVKPAELQKFSKDGTDTEEVDQKLPRRTLTPLVSQTVPASLITLRS